MGRFSVCVLMPLVLVGLSATAIQADSIPINEGQIKVPPDTRVTITVKWTRTDGDPPTTKVIKAKSYFFNNDTDKPATFKIEATDGPASSNDQSIEAEITGDVEGFGKLNASMTLPAGPVPGPSLAAWFADNGFLSVETAFDSPLAIGDFNLSGSVDSEDVSVFGLINDLSSFQPFASASNFPLGSLFATDSLGRVSNLPGLTFFSDAGFSTLYADHQLLIVGIESQYSVETPESPTLLLLGGGVTLLAGVGRSRRLKIGRDRLALLVHRFGNVCRCPTAASATQNRCELS